MAQTYKLGSLYFLEESYKISFNKSAFTAAFLNHPHSLLREPDAMEKEVIFWF